MKKILLVCILFFFPLNVFAKDLTLQCSCIVQFTDFYLQLTPITLTSKGVVKSENKKIGSYAAYDEAIFGTMNGNSFSYDTEKGLFILHTTIDGKSIPAYGACELAK